MTENIVREIVKWIFSIIFGLMVICIISSVWAVIKTLLHERMVRLAKKGIDVVKSTEKLENLVTMLTFSLIFLFLWWYSTVKF